jgi:hypothetical protein
MGRHRDAHTAPETDQFLVAFRPALLLTHTRQMASSYQRLGRGACS